MIFTGRMVRVENGKTERGEWLRLWAEVDAMHLSTWSGYVTKAPAIFERRHPDQLLTLMMYFAIHGFDSQNEFAVRDVEKGTETLIDGAVWADWDQAGWLVYAKGGKLFGATIDGDGELSSVELADFNDAKPKQITPLDWARMW